MSKIDKLLILGVRSFDNTHAQAITFNTPLTLIVGSNGSGKTTIIESLKYATTGELPPNSTRGGAFIHDPKLCGEKDVLAQVKLSFKSTSDAKMVVTRSLQLTVKKTTRTQKTLEGQLLMIKDGERTAISSRVAELDQIIPQYLGVSKAILESVIFCHQDESLWPMSEPSALKKRFDEIFEALKYTKAIDNIKQLRKKQNEELGKYKLMEQHNKEDKDKADKAEKKSRELYHEIETLRTETQNLHGKARGAANNAEASWNKAAAFSETVKSLSAARDKQDWYEKQVDDLRKDLKERSESDDWLQSELDSYEERTKVHAQRQTEQTKRYEDVRQEINNVRQRQSERRTEAGKHEQRKSTHEQKIKDRDLEIKRSAQLHAIRGYDTDLDDAEIVKFMDRIANMSKDQNAKVDRLRMENGMEVRKIQKALDNLLEQRSALQEGKRSARERIATNDRKITSAYSEIESIEADEGVQAILQSKIEDIEVKIKKAKKDNVDLAWESKTKDSNTQIQRLENKSVALNRELIDGTKKAGNLSRLDYLRKEETNRERSLKTMTSAHGDRLRRLIDQSWQPSTLEGDFQRIVDAKRREATDAERKRDDTSRDLKELESKLESSRLELKKKDEELRACVNELAQVNVDEPEKYHEALEAAKVNRDNAKRNVDGHIALKNFYMQGRERAISKTHPPACILCQRSFKRENDLNQFTAEIERLISQTNLSEMKKLLKECDDDLQITQDAVSAYDTWNRLRKELPGLRAQVLKFEEERESMVPQVEEHDQIVDERKEAQRDIETLAKTVANITKYNSELVGFQGQIRDLESEQKQASVSRTLEDIQKEIELTGAEIKSLRSSLVKLQANEQRGREHINNLELDLGRTKNKLTTATHELEKRANITAQIDDLKGTSHDQRESVIQLDRQLQELAPQFSEQETKLEDIKQRGESKQKDLQKEAANLSDSLRILERNDQEIKTYIEEGGPSQLARCEREIQGLEQEISKLEVEQKQIIIEINKIKEELGSQIETKRVIADNLKYRKSHKELDIVKQDIARMSAENAEADQSKHRKEAEQWQREYNRLNTDETSKMGVMKAKDDQLQQLLQDWDTDYKDAALKYKESHIRVETTKAAVEDLGRYGGALDKAIMKFHSLKMEEINRIVEELWKKTYQGTDVDTILIRSDHESAKANRSYNYRVCMVKSDAEMDMRGRCSAGQKVLASIIIRLALAECFGVNCGLIALDEPTTNLDAANIKSLAESLHEIITTRRNQSNFQLIVITHDEEFLRRMGCGDFADYYYRVSRNDRQKSVITRESVADVM